MRYYDLTLWPVSDKGTHGAASPAPLLHLSSYLEPSADASTLRPGGSPHTGVFDPGALDMSFQITETTLTHFLGRDGGAFVTLKGIDTTTLGQASHLTGAMIILKAGMGHGFPLAKPEQAGTVLQGIVASACGSWEGTTLSLTLFVSPYGIERPPQKGALGPSSHKSLYLFDCPQGASLRASITQAMKQLYPKAPVHFVSSHDPHAQGQVSGAYHSAKALCVALSDAWAQEAHVPLLTMVPKEGAIVCSDMSVPPSPKTIAMEDLIGQPSWNGAHGITVCCPLRADVTVNDILSLPSGPLLTHRHSARASPSPPMMQPEQNMLFGGLFRVIHVHHNGQFRSSSGQQWMTTLDCLPFSEAPSSPQA